ncbi:Sel1 repeat-containing protein [Nitrosomonas sp. Nm58]|nr:Sel1 repeat-containing protein [Nitrosomonas sp. Nm58]
MKKWLFVMMLFLSACAVPQESQRTSYWDSMNNSEKSAFLTQQFAKSGDSNEQLKLGDAYMDGLGMPQDSEKAFYWTEKAANGWARGANYKVGIMYQKGIGVEQNSVKAAEHFLKAIERDVDKKAMIHLGEMYLNGDGVEKNIEKGISLYERAAEGGDADAQFALGKIYFNDYRVPKNIKQAHYWLTTSAKNGYSDQVNSLLNDLDKELAQAEADEQEKARKAKTELNEAIRSQSYVKQLRQKYGKRLRYETAHAQTRIQSFNIDCRANDGRYLPLENVLLAKMASLDSKQAYLTIRATNRGDDVRIYDELISADGRRMGSIPMFEINKWGELRTLADVRIEAILNSCFGSFGPIWASR